MGPQTQCAACIVPEGRAPAEIAELLARPDLPIGQVDWWLSVFAGCNAHLSAELPYEEAHAWAEVYMEALDKSGLGLGETLWRKILVVCNTVQRFGAQEGDRVRDPDAAFAEFQVEVRISREALSVEYEQVVNALRSQARTDDLLERVRWRTGIRSAISVLSGLEKYVTKADTRHEIVRWRETGALLR